MDDESTERDAEEEYVDDDFEPPMKEGGRGHFVAGLLLGAALGAGIALLATPRTGAENRRHLARRFRKMRGRAEEELAALRREARRELVRRKKKLRAQLGRLAEEAGDAVDQVRRRV